MPVALQVSPVISFVTAANKHCLESARLNSFNNNDNDDDQISSWPHLDDSQCSRENMAKAGFFYTGQGDQVKCFVCRIKLDHWNPDEGDDPWQKHRELSSNCTFARLGKEESQLTVEQWCDINNSRTINMLDAKFNKFKQAT